MPVPVELDPDVDDLAPTGNDITTYDEQHYVTYLRLLDAKADGADWKEVAHIVLHRDPAGDEVRRGDAGKAISRERNGCRAKAIGAFWSRRSRRPGADRCR